MKYEKNHIFNDLKTYEDYIEYEFTSGNVVSRDELFFSKENFIAYKKSQSEHEKSINELLPSRFIWEESGIRLGYNVFDFIKQDDKGNTWRINKDKYELIGFCDASKIRVRPSSTGIVVLFKIHEDGEILDNVWVHFGNCFRDLFSLTSK